MLAEFIAITIFLALLIFLAKTRQRKYRPSFIAVTSSSPEIKPSKRHLKVWFRRNYHGIQGKKLDDLDLLLMRDRDQFVF